MVAGVEIVTLQAGSGLAATGRGRNYLDRVQCTIVKVDTPVQITGAQGAPGLVQVNVELLASLSGKGEVTVLLTVDGKVDNVVTLTIQ